MIQKSYIICSTGRTGSSLLARTLAELKYVGNATEYWHWKRVPTLIDNDSDVFQEYLASIIIEGTTPNGVFGIKMHLSQFRHFIQLARQHLLLKDQTDTEVVSSVFHNPSYIFIKRKDSLRQAISLEIAQQRQMFSSNESAKIGDEELIFKPLNIYRYQNVNSESNKKWQEFFEQNKIAPYEIIYEQFISQIEYTITDLIKFLKIEPLTNEDQIKIPMEKLSNSVNERWYKYYRKIPNSFLEIANYISQKFE